MLCPEGGRGGAGAMAVVWALGREEGRWGFRVRKGRHQTLFLIGAPPMCSGAVCYCTDTLKADSFLCFLFQV